MSDTRPRAASPVSIALLAGWLLPGAGYLATRHWIRALLVFLAVSILWWVGLGMNGQLFLPGSGNGVLDLLSFVGQLGAGLYYAVCYLGGFGQTVTTTAVEDYGTKFMIVASLLNVIAAVDAHNLRIGRKPSGLPVQTVAAPAAVIHSTGYTAGIPSAAATPGPVAPLPTGKPQ